MSEGFCFLVNWAHHPFLISGDVLEAPKSVYSMYMFPEEVSHLLGYIFVSHTFPDCFFGQYYVEDGFCCVPYKA